MDDGTAQTFQNGLSQLKSLTSSEVAATQLGIPTYLFPEPGKFFTAESLAAIAQDPSADPQAKPGIEDILWASRKRPEQVYGELQQLFSGFTFSEMGAFGGGSLYRLEAGTTVRYASLVRAKDRTATFVVIWQEDPNRGETSP
ncbi:MAG: hypothetical protein ACO34J_02720 [Prochlorothrix sp.]